MSKKGKDCTIDEINQITCDIDTFVARLFNELQPQYFSNYGLHIRTFIADPGVIVRGTSFCLSESANNVKCMKCRRIRTTALSDCTQLNRK